MISPAPARCVFEVPRLRTGCSANAHEHHMVRYRREEREKACVAGALLMYQMKGGACRLLPPLPVHVHFVRVSPGNRQPDPDNIFGYLKAAIDAVSRYYHVDDGNKAQFTFSVASERGPSHMVRVEIEART